MMYVFATALLIGAGAIDSAPDNPVAAVIVAIALVTMAVTGRRMANV